MPELFKARDNYTGEIQTVSAEWLERWPEDYTVLDGDAAETNPVPDKPVRVQKPSDGKHEKEQG